MPISYERKGEKYIVCKDGVYMSLTPAQVDEMVLLLKEIQRTKKRDANGD